MVKVLSQRKVQLAAEDLTREPFVSFSYIEEVRGFLNKEYCGRLTIDLVIADADGYTRTFETSFDTTPIHYSSNPSKTKRDFEERVLSFFQDEVVARMNLDLERRIEPDARSLLEREMMRKIADVVDLPGLMTVYDDRKRIIDEHQRDEKLRLTNARKSRLSAQRREELMKLEFDSMYGIAIDASRSLEYELSRKSVVDRVRALFDPDDNLLFRPLFKPAAKGEWARFVQEQLGDGLYFKLRNVEDDLDHFYAAIIDRISSVLPEEVKVARENYDEAIRTSFKLEEVLKLFERERDANTLILEKFQDLLGKGVVDYEQALEYVGSHLRFSGGLLTAVSPEVREFSMPALDKVKDKEQFDQEVRKIGLALASYLVDNNDSLRVPSTAKITVAKDLPVMCISHAKDTIYAQTGSYGKMFVTATKHAPEYDAVGFEMVTGKKIKLPFKAKVSLNNLVAAAPLTGRYNSIENACVEILNEALTKACATATNPKLDSIQQKIRGYHPYLSQERTFIDAFYDGMKRRFDGIFRQ